MKKLKVLLPGLILTFCMTMSVGFADELIVNVGFETGDLTGWQGENVAVTGSYRDIDPYEGDYHAVLSPDGSVDASLFQATPSAIGPITISFAYNAYFRDVPPESGADIFVAFGTTPVMNDLVSLTLDDSAAGGDWLPSVLGWRTFTTTFDTLPAPGPITIGFRVYNTPNLGGDLGQQAKAFIDNVSIDGTPIPEPTTLLLFGSGLVGLAALIRGKK